MTIALDSAELVPAVHPAALGDSELLAACELVRTRRSGPGGQRRNKVETAVVLRHRPSALRAEASERRSAKENLHVALFRLRTKLALEVRLPVAENWQPSALWQSRRHGGKLAINPEHTDFPALLAEALDVLQAAAADASAAAERLGLTTTQLVKLLAREPRALESLNAARQLQGLRPLR